VAKQGILGHAPAQAALKGVYIVNAFTHIDAFAKQVLINIGHSPGIQIESRITGENTRKERMVRANRFNFSAGL
jgi:hypothetical protein